MAKDEQIWEELQEVNDNLNKLCQASIKEHELVGEKFQGVETNIQQTGETVISVKNATGHQFEDICQNYELHKTMMENADDVNRKSNRQDCKYARS